MKFDRVLTEIECPRTPRINPFQMAEVEEVGGENGVVEEAEKCGVFKLDLQSLRRSSKSPLAQSKNKTGLELEIQGRPTTAGTFNQPSKSIQFSVPPLLKTDSPSDLLKKGRKSNMIKHRIHESLQMIIENPIKSIDFALNNRHEYSGPEFVNGEDEIPRELTDPKYSVESEDLLRRDYAALLRQSLETNSQSCKNLAHSLTRMIEFNENLYIQKLLAKEKSIDERERNLKKMSKNIKAEHKILRKKERGLRRLRKAFESAIADEQNQINDKKEAVEMLKNELNRLTRENEQIITVTLHESQLLISKIKQEEKSSIDELRSKEVYIKQTQQRFDTEITEAYNTIRCEEKMLEKQIVKFDVFYKSIPDLNTVLSERAQMCEIKSQKLLIDTEKVRRAQDILEYDKKIFDKKGEKVHMVCLELEQKTQEAINRKQEVAERKKLLEVKRGEVMEIVKQTKIYIKRIEILKQNLRIRKKCCESLKSQQRRFSLSEFKEKLYDGDFVEMTTSVGESFKASEFMKDLELYEIAGNEIKRYLSQEDLNVKASKLTYDLNLKNETRAQIYKNPLSFNKV